MMPARTAIAVSPVLSSAFARKPPDYSTTGAVNSNNTFCLCVDMLPNIADDKISHDDACYYQ